MSSEPRGGQCWLLVSNNREPRGKVGVATFLGVWMNFRSFPSGRLWPGCGWGEGEDACRQQGGGVRRAMDPEWDSAVKGSLGLKAALAAPLTYSFSD